MPMPSFTAAACGGAIDIGLQEPFALLLEENPTTGYRWDIDTDLGLRVTSSDYAPAAGIGIGGGGTRRFLLVADKAGNFGLRAKLWRQWLGDASATRRCEITVRAK